MERMYVCVHQVVYLKKNDDEQLLVLDPDWLGTDVIGQLFSEETVTRLPHDGRITVDDLRTVIPASPPLDTARLLTTMNICAQLHPGLDNDIILPCLDRSEEPSSAVRRPVVNGVEHTVDKVSVLVRE